MIYQSWSVRARTLTNAVRPKFLISNARTMAISPLETKKGRRKLEMKTLCNTWNLCWSKPVFRGILKVENQPIISFLFLKQQATNYKRTPAKWHIVGRRTESKIDWNKNRKEIQLIFALLWFPRRVIFNYESILYIRKINIYNWNIFLWWIFRMLT